MEEDVVLRALLGRVVRDVVENVRMGEPLDEFELAVLEPGIEADFFDRDVLARLFVVREKDRAKCADADRRLRREPLVRHQLAREGGDS